MKTLGQIIDEEFPDDYWEDLINYAYDEPMLAVNREELEGFAQAVRNAVIEECARAFDGHPSDPPSVWAAKRIRALKDKK